VGENEIAEDGGHERIGAAFGEKLVDPGLKTAVKSEFSGKDFVLGEDQEEYTHADTEKGQSSEVPGIRREWHAGIIIKPSCGKKKNVRHADVTVLVAS
jgi:hypothetical protein